MFQIEQKKCKGTRNVLLWHIMVLNCHVCLVWPYVTLYGLLWPRMVLMLLFTAMAMFGLIRISMDLCVLVWTCMALFGLVWHFMVFYGRISSFLAVIDPNSFGLVFLYLSKNCVKMGSILFQ